MAVVYITLKIMPEDPSVNLAILEKLCRAKIESHKNTIHSVEQVPIAFGIIALEFMLMADEKNGGTDELEAELAKISGVASVQVTDVRRGIG